MGSHKAIGSTLLLVSTAKWLSFFYLGSSKETYELPKARGELRNWSTFSYTN
jgi:hypothetical protein